MAQLTKDDDIEIAAMERALELDPTDSSTRFSLAFKHSGRDHHALAAWHYSRISASDRHGMAWNNLGVALQRLDLPGKSVQAYREAEKKDETLAMSNLANKFVDAGFMSEAKALCERASKITDYHRNVDVSKSRIADAIDDETKVETEKFSEAKIESDFYKGLGRSLLLSNVCDLNGEWAGPDCTLSFSVSDSKIVAEGQYEPVLYGMSKILGLTSEPSVMKIEYVGMRIRGAIISTVIRKEIKAEVVVKSLLSSFEDSTNALMSVQENCREIWIMERNKNDKPKYYKIFRK
jgi:tetratricopeptide (TPR) repeat protein